MRRTLLIFATALALSACVRTPDYCGTAPQRRATYTAAIRATDLWALSGRPVPQAVVMGRQAANTALSILDATCPAAVAE